MTWSAANYSSDYESEHRVPLAQTVYQRVFRTDFTEPGFFLIRFPALTDSFALRSAMVELKQELDRIHHQLTHRRLSYQSVGRFDQQATTRPHRDNAPDESILMLGYEPTAVEAHLSLYDYSKCAFENGMSPENWLNDHNPMYVAGEQLLQNDRTELPPFDADRSQIVLINNSIRRYNACEKNLLGVLHTAEVPVPRPEEKRIVNSTMIGVVPAGEPEVVSEEDVQTFLTTNEVRERMYAS